MKFSVFKRRNPEPVYKLAFENGAQVLELVLDEPALDNVIAILKKARNAE